MILVFGGIYFVLRDVEIVIKYIWFVFVFYGNFFD